MTRLAAKPAPMTVARSAALIRELDRMTPAAADRLTPFERATYRRAIDTSPRLAARHRAALLLTIARQETR